MFTQEFKNIKSGKKELKEFGLIMSTALSLLNLFLFWKKGEISIILIPFSVLFLLLNFRGSRLLKPFHKIWMSFSLILGKLSTAVILTILFYFIITPIGLAARLLKKDFLDLKFDKKQNSYWQAKNQSTVEKKSYEKQF